MCVTQVCTSVDGREEEGRGSSMCQMQVIMSMDQESSCSTELGGKSQKRRTMRSIDKVVIDHRS